MTRALYRRNHRSVLPHLQAGDNLLKRPVRRCRASAAEIFGSGWRHHRRHRIGGGSHQGNYATLDQMTADMAAKLGGGSVGIVFPILSRNRFSLILKAAAQSCKKLYVQLSYPSDEVGNALVSWETVDEKGINPYTDHFDEQGFRAMFGPTVHPFTGVDYTEYYKALGTMWSCCSPATPPTYLTTLTMCSAAMFTPATARPEGCAGRGLSGAYPRQHPHRERSGQWLQPRLWAAGLEYGHRAVGQAISRDCQPVVEGIQARMMELTGKRVEVLIYGDGCFKDP